MQFATVLLRLTLLPVLSTRRWARWVQTPCNLPPNRTASGAQIKGVPPGNLRTETDPAPEQLTSVLPNPQETAYDEVTMIVTSDNTTIPIPTNQ